MSVGREFNHCPPSALHSLQVLTFVRAFKVRWNIQEAPSHQNVISASQISCSLRDFETFGGIWRKKSLVCISIPRLQVWSFDENFSETTGPHGMNPFQLESLWGFLLVTHTASFWKRRMDKNYGATGRYKNESLWHGITPCTAEATISSWKWPFFVLTYLFAHNWFLCSGAATCWRIMIISAEMMLRVGQGLLYMRANLTWGSHASTQVQIVIDCWIFRLGIAAYQSPCDKLNKKMKLNHFARERKWLLSAENGWRREPFSQKGVIFVLRCQIFKALLSCLANALNSRYYG